MTTEIEETEDFKKKMELKRFECGMWPNPQHD